MIVPSSYFQIASDRGLADVMFHEAADAILTTLRSHITEPDKTIIVVFDGDLDGVSASGLFRYYLKQVIDSQPSPRNTQIGLLPIAHGSGVDSLLQKTINQFKNNDVVFVVLDFMIDKVKARLFEENECRVIWIDHHAIQEDFSFNDAYIKLFHSTALKTPHATTAMVYALAQHHQEACNIDEAQLLSLKLPVEIVNHYDTGGAFNQPDHALTSPAKCLNAFLHKTSEYGNENNPSPEIFALSELFNLEENYHFDEAVFYDYLASGMRILEVKENILNAVARSAVSKKDITINDLHPSRNRLTVAMIMHSDSRNELSEIILNDDPNVDFVAVMRLINTGEETRVKVSLRSTHSSKIDLGKLATRYGGGGHKTSAGFELSLSDFSTNPITGR